MTDEREARADLLELHSAIDLLHDGLAITDKDGLFIYMNPSHATLFDYPRPDDLVGKSWSTLYRPEIAEWFGRFVMPRLFSNGAWRGEAEGVSATGRPVLQEVSLTVSATGGIICVTRDIAGRKRDEAIMGRLRDWLADASLEATLQRKLDRTCHDISNYLAVADARIATAEAIVAGSPVAAHLGAAALAVRGAQSTAASARSGHRAKTSSEPIDLVPLVRRAASLQSSEPSTAVSVCLECAFASVTCDLDALMFMRAITNLIQNAFEAGGEDDIVLTLASEAPEFSGDAYSWRSSEGPPGPRIVVSVRDFGTGISRENISQICNAYFSTKTGKAVATRGLGLDAVMELIGRARGALHVASAPGSGSQFDLILPATDFVETTRTPSRRRARQVKRVALVDDDPNWLDLLSARFQRRSIAVIRFGSARAMIDSIAQGSLDSDAIVVDRFLGDGEDGLNLGAIVRDRCPEAILVCLSSAPPDLSSAPHFDVILDKSMGVDRAIAEIMGQ